jgi:hypothetical protein
MSESPAAKFAAMRFAYDGDARANREIERRIAQRAVKRRTIPYSELVDGVTFRLPNVAGGSPFQLGELGEWTGLDSAILGSVLGRISADSYVRAGFLASAVAVSKSTDEPSEGFKALVREAGLLRSTKGDAFVLFWSDQLTKAYDWYAANPPAP